jgi:predicted subunit of tRNA(5-methylaminomethyl-2-thiouridylate) methyltransferase
MKTCVLYSGGKDSSLIAVILERLGYNPELVTINFGVFDSWKPASLSASSLGFKHRVLMVDSAIIEKAVQMILNDKFPNNGINYIHKKALETVSGDYDVIADGTRRDDRIPKLEKKEIKSFEDSKDVEYITLDGFGHKTIDDLSKRLFTIIKEQTDRENNSDYEIEVRYLIDKIEGEGASSNIFPEHVQSRVVGWREEEKEKYDPRSI